MEIGLQEAPATRKRFAETDAERLEEEVTSAEADSDRCLALKRKAEGDPHDSEVENTVMDSLVESWRENNDPNDEIDLLICQHRDQYVASAHETGTDRPVFEEPRTPFPCDEVDGITSTTRVASCSTALSSIRRRIEEISVIRELGVWEVVDRPRGDVVFGTRWVDINKGDENKPFYRSLLVVQEYKRQADWSFFTNTPPLEGTAKIVDLCNSRRVPQ